MKLTLGLTFTLLVILQTFQQVSAEEPNQVTPMQDSMEGLSSNVDTNPNNSGDGEADLFLLNIRDQQLKNSTELDEILHMSGNETEEASSEGPNAILPPPTNTLNSSSEMSPESNETQTHETATNSSTAEHNHHLNDTKTTPKPEANTTESNSHDSGSGVLPSDDVPTNSTTKSPITTTNNVNKTTANHTEPTLYPTPTETEEMTDDPNGQLENRENSGRDTGTVPVQNDSESKNKAWAVVLIVGIVVGILALTAFIVLNRKNRRDISHRKLVEETSPDPVLRLDNGEPLDLKFDGFGYYNPGLEADNIQMTNFPQGRSK